MKPRRPLLSVPTRTLDTELDGLLRQWYEYQKRYQLTRGFTRDGRTTGSFQTPGHMDWANGAADARADELVIAAVDAAIARVPNLDGCRWRTALEFHARNLYYRISVWYSPLLPATKEERDVLLREALNLLAHELRKEGVMGW
jgi:hypothetical protein